MRMPPHHFLADSPADIVHRKEAFLFCNLRVHHDLQQQIPEFFLQSLAADCNLSVEQLRGPAKALAEDVMRMTDAQLKRVAEQMFRQVEIRRDGVDLILWGQGLVRYFTKGIKK